MNQAFVQMLGYPSREALLAMSAGDLYVNSADRQRFREAVETGEVREFELRLRRHDGSAIWIKQHASVIRDDRGQPQFYDGSPPTSPGAGRPRTACVARRANRRDG